MFNIRIGINVAIADCPEKGLAAVDFRRRHGIPEAPTNVITLKYEGINEQLCRELSDYLNGNADFVLANANGKLGPDEAVSQAAIGLVGSIQADAKQQLFMAGRHAVDVAVVTGFLRTPSEHLITLVDVLEQAAEKNREEWSRTIANLQVREAEDAQSRAEKERLEKEAIERLRQWAEKNGSELLKARLAERFEWEDLARHEFVWKEIEAVASHLNLAEMPKGYKTNEVHDYPDPELYEIEEYRLVRRKAEGRPVEVRLVMVAYQPETPGDGSGNLIRELLRLQVTTPDGSTKKGYFIIPKPKPVSPDVDNAEAVEPAESSPSKSTRPSKSQNKQTKRKRK